MLSRYSLTSILPTVHFLPLSSSHTYTLDSLSGIFFIRECSPALEFSWPTVSFRVMVTKRTFWVFRTRHLEGWTWGPTQPASEISSRSLWSLSFPIWKSRARPSVPARTKTLIFVCSSRWLLSASNVCNCSSSKNVLLPRKTHRNN